MRFMVMHKQTAEMESGEPPPPEVIEGVGKLLEEGVKSGVFVSGEGLKPTSQRVHLAYKDGQRTLTRGPFKGKLDLPGGFGLFRVRSEEEAIGWCDKFAAVLGDVELFLGPVVEPWDLGMMEKPKNAPLRFLSTHRMDESRPAAPPSPELMAKMGALIAEMTDAGVLQATGALAGTAEGARIRFEGKQHSVIDGPFAESKELIAGYVILELPSKQAAIDYAVGFADVVKVEEIDIRLMQG
ncbi:MAG: hypothetical protein H6718_12385 [Polyangiaceae bacterium]|nr:hypothetical protein [Myxococcales bacterium]MCB9586191.1 hypothetical protein [Polyangiaceae bacterium]MCB9606868.1 hypothetical protein [Polyangiaceae bacterium]